MKDARAYILDLDLDFFLSDIAHWPSGDRLDAIDFVPWSESRVRRFLEKQCGLSVEKPIPGKVVKTHDEVFKHWRAKISAGEWEAPFSVTHIDAHADLGLGDSSYIYLLGELLGLPSSRRTNPREGTSGLNEGSYLAFALACEWIDELVYVYHCSLDRPEDLPAFYFNDCNPETGAIQLKQYRPEEIRAAVDAMRFPGDLVPVRVLDPVPFHAESGSAFKDDRGFDFVYLSKSPAYTPPESDGLVSVITEYMDM